MTRKEKHVRADVALHAEEAQPEKKERTPRINKYGFLHVDKSLAEHLGVEFGKDKADVPVTIECARAVTGFFSFSHLGFL